MTVLEIVQAKLKNADIAMLDIEVAIGEIEQVIKNYCALDTVPEALCYTWANMTIDLISYTYQASTGIKSIDGLSVNADYIEPTDISSLKVGDTQVNLDGSKNGSSARARALSSHKPSLDSITMNYQKQLNMFRRMVW